VGFYVPHGTIQFSTEVWLSYLLCCLKSPPARDIERVLVCDNSPSSELRQLHDDVFMDVEPRWTAGRLMEEICSALGAKNASRRWRKRGRELRLSRRIDVLLGMPLRDPYTRIRTLSWLSDFQHMHFPSFFSAAECRDRNEAFREVARHATRLVVMSQSVLADLEAFDGAAAKKARVVPIVAAPAPELCREDPRKTAEQYGLPAKFVYIPNQFWQHKNHLAAIEAIKLLRDGGCPVFAVFSGKMEDYRNPAHVPAVLARVESLGIKDRVRFLSVIPREHVIALTRRSIGIVNPSLFEGYGLSVDEARSFGKPVLASDIRPHREQSYRRADYFDPRNSHDMAEKLAKLWQAGEPGPDLDAEASAAAELPLRQQQCAAIFGQIVREVLESDIG
jgi:glycosyltransferase involved in cell wall biosynthesis